MNNTHTDANILSFSTSSEGNTSEANALLNIVENSYTIHRAMVTVILHILTAVLMIRIKICLNIHYLQHTQGNYH